MLARQERAGEIDVDDGPPDIGVEAIRTVIDCDRLDRGIRDHDVEPAETLAAAAVAATTSSSTLISAVSASAVPPDASMSDDRVASP